MKLNPIAVALALALNVNYIMAEEAPKAEDAVKVPDAEAKIETKAETLPEVAVNAEKDETTLPIPYAGGQVARGGRVGLLGDKDFLDTPFSTTNFTSEYIQNQQARTLGDIITRDPSVRSPRSTNQLYQSFTLRGFPLFANESAFNGLYGAVPVGSVATEGVERIDLFKGPNAFLNGISPNGSIAGGINVVPKRATNAPITRLSTDFATDSEFGGHIDFGRRFGEDKAFGVRVNAVKREGDGAVDRQRSDRELIAIGADFKGERVRISADVAYQDLALFGTQGSLELDGDFKPPKAPSGDTNWSQSYQYQTTQDTYGVLRGEFDITKDMMAFAAIGGRDSKYGEFRSYDIISNTAGDFLDEPYLTAEDTKTVSAELGIRGAISTGILSHQISAVASIFKIENAYSDFNTIESVPSNIFNYIKRPKPDTSFVNLNTIKNDDARNSSFALADTIGAFNDNLQVTLGARHQRVKTRNFNPDGSVIAEDTYDESAVTPALGIVVKPFEKISVYANYIEGLTQGPTAPTSAANAGKVFAPFKSDQIEAGVKVDLGELAVTASVYEISRPNGFTDSATNIFGLDGEQRNRGLEINTFGELTDHVRILGGVAFQDAKLTKTRGGLLDGQTAQGVPKVQVNLGAEWDVLALSGLTLTSDLNYTGSQYTQTSNNFKIPSYAVLDIGGRYSFKANDYPITIRANLDNVFDKDYWATANRGLGLGAPRRLSLSATIDF